MIPAKEVLHLRGEWQLRADVIEKDYVLGWLLAAIAAATELAETWVFKGGTCLRKCYYETYRFSEDLDFTVLKGGPEEPEDLVRIFQGVATWLYDHAGIELEVDDRSFRRRHNRRGHPTTIGRIGFRGPNDSPSRAKVKLDLTSDEVVVKPPVVRQILHPYSDQPLPVPGVLAYSIVELLGEKLRALAERCRPRDLYDVINVYRHPDLIGHAPAVLAVLDQKSTHAGIATPTIETIRASRFRQEVEQEWENMLAHQLPHLPLFADFWERLDELFAWLRGDHSLPRLDRAEFGQLDPAWTPPRAMASWRSGQPLELIRFAGANRLLVELDYRPERGRSGPRAVEAYSFRRSRDGNLLLFVRNDHGMLRSYRVDRIAGIRVLDRTFQPRYLIEF